MHVIMLGRSPQSSGRRVTRAFATLGTLLPSPTATFQHGRGFPLLLAVNLLSVYV